ncbi:hypothetical protein CSKR_105310 [Clonorchis sinensis]|uniref:Uncharacterized protein n=1 Tax=Clonorchis sinensis TaxID=79923 RepID=A0A419QI87_CLOSI|nr:hypothetical protein CSKR_105310 [Clonorchis sinensis]
MYRRKPNCYADECIGHAFLGSDTAFVEYIQNVTDDNHVQLQARPDFILFPSVVLLCFTIKKPPLGYLTFQLVRHSRYLNTVYKCSAPLIRLPKTFQQPTTCFALPGSHQVDAVPEFSFFLNPNKMDHINWHTKFILTGDSSESSRTSRHKVDGNGGGRAYWMSPRKDETSRELSKSFQQTYEYVTSRQCNFYSFTCPQLVGFTMGLLTVLFAYFPVLVKPMSHEFSRVVFYYSHSKFLETWRLISSYTLRLRAFYLLS